MDGGKLAALLLGNEWRERGVAQRCGFGAEHRLPEDEQRGEETGPVQLLIWASQWNVTETEVQDARGVV